MRTPANEKPRQLPLELRHSTAFSRDDLFVTDCNHAAVERIDAWPEWSSPITVLAGPTGCGKSHLAAIWQEKAEAVRLETSSLGLADLQQLKGIPLLIDDIGAEPFDENGLFHLINTVREANTYLLMASRRLPSAWPVRLPDLVSRLKAVTIVEISEPDDQLLSGVMTKLFADRQISVEPHVIAYLVHRIERSLETVSQIVDRLDRMALEQRCRITRALAARVVSEMDGGRIDHIR